MIRIHRCVGAIALALAVGGCQLDQWVKNGFKVGPNYQQAPVPLAERWIDYQGAPTTQPAATQPGQAAVLAKWWEVFGDPVLNSLMHDAYRQNLTLRAAAERIVQAKVGADLATSNLLPQSVPITGSHTVNKASNRNALGTTNQWFQDVGVGMNVSWELDFWGRYRRAIEASDAALDASVANFDNVMVLLLSDVASNYIQYRTFQQRLVLAQRNVEIQRQSFELAQNNFKAGASTERDMQQARQVYEQTRALIPLFEQGMRQSNDALCVLLGVPVKDLASRLGETGMIPWAPADVAIGIPADLLRRRPDIRQAEREAAAQSAAIGIAESDLYPRFALNGTIGLNAEYFGGMFHTPGSMVGSLGPSFQWDILNYGRIDLSVKGQASRFRESVLKFQQTVLNANREVEDAAFAVVKTRERAALLQGSVDAARRTVQITHDQYKGGVIDFTPVFLFEQQLTEQEDAMALSQGDIAQSMVSLYKSVGGGWEARLQPGDLGGPSSPPPAPTTQPVDVRNGVMPAPLQPYPVPATRAATNPS